MVANDPNLGGGSGCRKGGERVGNSEGPSNTWRRSTASGGGGGNCVEVSIASDYVLMRHSRNPQGPRLKFSLAEWEAFLTGVRNGEFDSEQPGS